MDDIHVRVPIEEELHFGVRFGTSIVIPVSGLTEIRRISSSDYAALPVKSADTLYIVQYSDHIALYLGDMPCKDPAAVHSSTVDYLEGVTQAQYDALDPPDDDTIYAIRGAT
jgi:hypothetical protein